ncbi:MAG: PQQ-binding-like beta-propeller repeat protein, partial [Myxococcales bacterium]|nr:PQQ-binding-like beta-propeller repeat protein [Myxococcales bacterium]
MQAYRETVPGAPLVAMIGEHIVALDAETGALHWNHPVERHVTRVVVAGALVFVATDDEQVSTLSLFDLTTGMLRGSMPLPFRCLGALVSGDRVYFSGGNGLLAIRNDGRVMFQIRPQIMKKSAWDGDTVDLVAHDAAGGESWRLPSALFSTRTY